jgi:outer membrane murein-binding lipoprotein Lpp
MARFAVVAPLLAGVCLIGCASKSASEERSLSVFAQRVQRQLEVATDPTAVKRNEISTRDLEACVQRLRHRQEQLRASVAADRPGADLTGERIELLRIERQLQMIDRLLMRYEQNASFASTH